MYEDLLLRVPVKYLPFESIQCLAIARMHACMYCKTKKGDREGDGHSSCGMLWFTMDSAFCALRVLLAAVVAMIHGSTRRLLLAVPQRVRMLFYLFWFTTRYV